MQVLKTKLSRPSMASDRAMQRPQLLSQMVNYCQSSLVFIHAAAGYGKTTLMYQLSERLAANGKRVGWLTLDSDDNDPIRLYQYLQLALLPREQLVAIAHGQIHKQHIIELAQQVALIEIDTVLFIDELDVLDNQESLNILWWLYQYLPQNAHLVIASRVKPNWSFVKEYLLGRLKWVTEEHLSIKSQESPELIHFLQQQNFDHVSLSPELAEQLIHKTEGWFTGIQLTNLYLKENQDIHGFIQNLNGAHHQIVNYLSEQVFLQQDAEIQQFLLQISVLRKLNVALVIALTANNTAQQMLDAISQKSLFIQALDDQRMWYRIHHLFRDFLQAKFKLLQPDCYKQMHCKAAEWFKQQRYLMDAIYHAQQAEDQQLILSLLNSVCRELILEGRHYTFLELVKQLPDAILLQNPKLLYDIIWSLVLTHQATLANHYLQLWHSVDQHEALLQHEDQLGLAPLIAVLEDKLELAYTQAQQNLAQLASTAYFSRAPLIGIGALYQICSGHMTEGRKLLLQTRILYLQGHNLYGLAMVDCVDALCDYLLGDLILAAEKFSQIGQSDEYRNLGLDADNKAAIMNILSSFKADLYYEMNRISQVEDALIDFNGGDHLAMPDMVMVGYILQMRLATLRQDQAAIQLCSNQAYTRSSQWSLPRLAHTVQLYVQQQLKPYSGLADVGQGTFKPFLNFTHLLRGDDLIPIRTQIFTGQVQPAVEYLSQQLDFFKIYPIRQARVQVLLALALYQLKQAEQALDHLQQALERLMPTHAVRVILDEHPLIWDMLADLSQHLARQQQKHLTTLIAYIQHLQKLHQTETSGGVSLNSTKVEPLSKREIQILEKLSQGCTDAEISESIFLSINTVKWHLRKIYNKLQVRSRMEAVNEAKKQGLIE